MPQNLTDAEYKEKFKAAGPLQVKLTEKIGKCQHNLGDTFIYDNPYKKPAGLCNALIHVLDLYTWRAALGFPSWEADDREIFRIHCPSKKGTVWELTKLDKE